MNSASQWRLQMRHLTVLNYNMECHKGPSSGLYYSHCTLLSWAISSNDMDYNIIFTLVIRNCTLLSYAETFIQRVEACIHDIDIWMVNNRLKQNGEKTEVLFTYKSGFSQQNVLRPLNISGVSIQPADHVRSLGVTLDSGLTLNRHISTVCSAASLHIRNLGKIRHLLSQSVTEKLVHAFITARLDYCNSILYGLPKKVVKRLQLIQNTAARLVTRSKRDSHITPVLESLHWLPVQERIIDKVLLLTYKAIHGSAPSYISELISNYTPGRNLRSSTINLLCQRSTRLLQYGGRSFSSAAPKLWNQLPDYVRNAKSLDIFKRKLKTHLFSAAYWKTFYAEQFVYVKRTEHCMCAI